MTTTYNETIGSGLDHADVATWEAATDTNLVSLDEIRWGLLNTTDSPYSNEYVLVSGATTDATRYRGLKPAVGSEHDGTPGSGAVLQETRSGGFAGIRAGENYFHLEGIETGGGGTGSRGVTVVGDVLTLMHNILCFSHAEAGVSAASATGADKVTIDNCFFQQCTSAVLGNSGDTDAVHCRHCAAVRQQADTSSSSSGFRYVKVTNTAAFHFGPSGGHKDFLSIDAGSATYAASDSSGSPAALDSLTASDQFVSITDGAMDLTLKAGSDLEGAGTGGVLVLDWEGDTRDVSTPDVGADEFVAAGGFAGRNRILGGGFA